MKTTFSAVTVCALALLTNWAFADVDVFRAIDKKNATFAKVADAQWRIDPDGLSTFEAAHFNVTNKACKVRFTVQGVNPPFAQGDQGDIQNFAGYIGIYTPQHGGAGHWSITQAVGAAVPSEITAFVIANNATLVNVGYNGTPSLCQTPAAPN